MNQKGYFSKKNVRIFVIVFAALIAVLGINRYMNFKSKAGNTAADFEIYTSYATSCKDAKIVKGWGVGEFGSGNWIKLSKVDLSTGYNNLAFRYATKQSNATMQVRIDSLNGTILGTVYMAGTNDWNNFVWGGCNLNSATAKGVHDVYLIMTNGAVNNVEIAFKNISNNVPAATLKPTVKPVVTAKPATASPVKTSVPAKTSAPSYKSAATIVKEMRIGWNLGNTLDSSADWIKDGTPQQYETAWGNPVTTKDMITKIKQAGFNTVRVPVTWKQHMGAGPDYKVNDAWMNRVKEVVDYCISNNMYVIVDVHHDGSWLYPDNVHYSAASKQLEKLWTQIANKFKNYNQRLIFETMNEPRLEGTSMEWSSGTVESRAVINKYNKIAVNAIRQTGGSNSHRAIMIPGYAANQSVDALNAIEIPNGDKMIILSVHAYSPYPFAMQSPGTSTWGSASDKAAIDTMINNFYTVSKSKGAPIVIGEFGAINKNNDSYRIAWASYYVKQAKAKGMTCIAWDNGTFTANKAETFGLFNRKTLTIAFPSLVNAYVSSAGK